MEEHIAAACRATHPCLNLADNLEPTWRYAFDQWDTSFGRRGFRRTVENVNDYRRRARRWVDRVACTLEPLRREAMASAPFTSSIIASHIHVPLLYVLLLITDFPNPELAFRPFLGACLVGIFSSPALTARVPRFQDGLPFNNENLRAISIQASSRIHTVRDTLSDAAAEKCMAKMDKEFASKSLVGP